MYVLCLYVIKQIYSTDLVMQLLFGRLLGPCLLVLWHAIVLPQPLVFATM
jgi:hypothetical protein